MKTGTQEIAVSGEKLWKSYEIIATGGGEKLERWGDVVLLRPDPQAIWEPPFDLSKYKGLSARYVRSKTGGGGWEERKKLPPEWTVDWEGLKFLIKPMGFKHTGLFPEQAQNWHRLMGLVKEQKRQIRVINLFAYTGGATVALAKAGAHVTHVDAAKGMVERAKDNCRINGIKEDSLRFIIDDCSKFLEREARRGKTYDGIIMDPPSYGRGPSGEVWHLEDGLCELTRLAANVLSDDPLFYLINSYTTGLQPTVISNVLSLAMKDYKGKVRAYEVTLPTLDRGLTLPCGCSGLWTAKEGE